MFPPWLAVTNWADGHADRDPIGRHFVLAPPGPAVPEELRDTVEARRRGGAALYSGPDFYVVDTTRLIIPIAILTAITAVGLLLLRDRRGPT